MKISNEQAEYLLKLPKKIVKNSQILEKLTISQKFPLNEKFELLSDKDDDFTFLFEISQSKKHSIRLNFHCQENESKIGLLRVDYNSGHKNPESISPFLPEKFHAFAGKEFTNKEHHVHYHIDGYKPLAWAIPIINDDFKIKEISEDDDFNGTFAEIILQFAKTINIETAITINKQLL
ncbi:hypothetical protein [Bacteroides sp.]|uniref:DUF6978 family protein n=3 Tax=Bacteroides sp. TaxID=29523 RepID=UPI001B4B59BD|nr:hypothetical protein [Bacteroides sp.]MBP6355693.1 hypothetical protein [Paludibacter sp.]MBP6936460.1 hypothetical protein [Bacteroides sp.]